MRVNLLKKIYESIDTGEAQEKMSHIPPFPKIIEFEITNHCNYQCIMCPTGIGTARRERGYMSDDVFNKVIDELSDVLDAGILNSKVINGKNINPRIALKFVGQGEPLLHPKAIEYIMKSHGRGIITHLTTNGSLLTDEVMRNIVESQILDSIKFSFQGVDREGYLVLRQKDSFDELIKTIQHLYEIRGDMPLPYITIGTSITNERAEVTDAFIDLVQDICDKVEVGMTQLEDSELSMVKNVSYRKKLELLRSRQISQKKRYVCCPQIFDVITVRWNGDISACCGDVHGEMTLGNIMDTSIRECWNGQKENAYRKILAEGRYEDISACKDCYDIYGWTYGEN